MLLSSSEPDRAYGKCRGSISKEERSYSLRSIELMSAQRQEVDAEREYIYRDLPYCLGGVSMHYSPMLMGKVHKLCKGLNRADFVICQLHAQKEYIIVYEGARSFEIHAAGRREALQR